MTMMWAVMPEKRGERMAAWDGVSPPCGERDGVLSLAAFTEALDAWLADLQQPCGVGLCRNCGGTGMRQVFFWETSIQCFECGGKGIRCQWGGQQ